MERVGEGTEGTRGGLGRVEVGAEMGRVRGKGVGGMGLGGRCDLGVGFGFGMFLVMYLVFGGEGGEWGGG